MSVEHTGTYVRRRLPFTLAWLIVALPHSVVHAGFVTWEFAGEITRVDDPGGLVADLVTIGSTFSASYTFDPRTPDASPSDPEFGNYVDALVAFAGQVGDINLAGLGSYNRLTVLDNFLEKLDDYRLDIDAITIPVFGQPGFLDVWFTDKSAMALASDLLPVVPLDLSMYEHTEFNLRTLDFDVVIRGTITSLTPEPSTLAFLVVGAMFVTRRRMQLPRARQRPRAT